MCPEKVCQHCGKAFVPRTHNAQPKYCSSQCQADARRRVMLQTCKHCGATFQISPSQTDIKYCSARCRHDALEKRATRTCELCGATFHINHGHYLKKYCSHECETVAKTKKASRVCEHCGQTFVALSHRKFCSKACAIAHAHGKNARNWKGRSHEKQCEICGKTFVATDAEERQGRARFCSKTCMNKWLARNQRTVTCAYCGKQFPAIPADKRRRFCSRECFFRGMKPTSIELALMAELQARSIPFVSQYRVGRFWIDIAMPAQRVAIEADGDYWHHSDKVKERDKRKTAYLKKQGWKVIRFTEAQINDHLNACLARIVRLLYAQLPCI